MTILANAFSLNMLSSGFRGTIRVEEISLEEARELLREGFTSAIGHKDTAVLLEGLLGVPVPFNRVNVALEKGTRLIVAQYRGPRLEESQSPYGEASHATVTPEKPRPGQRPQRGSL